MNKVPRLLYSPGHYNDLTDAELATITVIQVIIFAFGGFTILLWLVNFWKYLIRAKRYKELTNLLFYFNAILVMICVLIDV